MKTMSSVIVIVAFLTSVVSAAPEIPFGFYITEIWPGNEPGASLTEDWFEITNLGDEAWTSALGDIYFDDDSLDTSEAVQLLGVNAIALGESVVFVDGGPAGAAQWQTVWGPVLGSSPQVGYYEGADLDQDGDSVAIFFDSDLNGIDSGDDLVGLESYPDASLNGGQSYDGFFDKFTTSSFGTVTIAVNDQGQPAIGTPGFIPEPTAIVLAGLGLMPFALWRRRTKDALFYCST